MIRLLSGILAVWVTQATTLSVYADTMALPVPVRTIYPKEQINSEDFTLKDFEVNGIARQTYVMSVNQVSRQVARRVLRVGNPVPLAALARKSDVHKGEQVIARFVSDGIEIQGILVPEQDGFIGDILRARNPETGVSVAARVQEDATLAVEASK